jgi:putative glutamine amidotransferase
VTDGNAFVTSKISDRPVPPLIGLSTYVETARFGSSEERVALLPQTYVSAVARAGGSAVLLPPSSLDPMFVLSALHGLVVAGGPDIDPRRYGASPHRQTDPPRGERDVWEIALCQRALASGLPLLAICRGLQVLNVSLGGTLHQHLPDIVGHDSHRAGQLSPNRVELKTPSAVASMLGTETRGYCHHHQAIDDLGAGLEAVGFAADGTVEAVERPGNAFAIGVQWHPEENPADDRLFAGLVQAATKYRATTLTDGHPAYVF